MTARGLLRLYPRAWRERYGEEFLESVGDAPVSPLTALDIVAGAIDAWWSKDVRQSTAGAAVSAGGSMTVIEQIRRYSCARQEISKRDALIGAAIIVGGSFAGLALERLFIALGWPELGNAVPDVAFPAAFLVGTNAMWLNRYSWRVRLVLSAIPTAILIAASIIGRLT